MVRRCEGAKVRADLVDHQRPGDEGDDAQHAAAGRGRGRREGLSSAVRIQCRTYRKASSSRKLSTLAITARVQVSGGWRMQSQEILTAVKGRM